MATPSWCTIESDPGVFTELISQIGVKGVQVEELENLEDSTFSRLKPILGLIFLFKWQEEKKEVETNRIVLEDGAPGVFFAQQVIPNACATQALVNILLNRPDVELGAELAGYKSFTDGLPPEMKGLVLSNSELIRTQHNSFARPEPFVFEEKRSKGDEDDDVFHFIGYLPVNGTLYELDGLQKGPILLGDCTNENWLEKVRPVIQARIAKYQSKEIRFALMAVVENRMDVYKKRLTAIEKRKVQLNTRLTGGSSSSSGMDTSDDGAPPLPTNEADIKTELSVLEVEEKQLHVSVDDEEHKYARWKAENIRRKHNYVPFVFNLLKSLAEKGKLQGLVESGSKATAEKVAKAKAEREKKAAAKKAAAGK